MVAGLAEKLRTNTEGAPGISLGIGIAEGTTGISVGTGAAVAGMAVGVGSTVSVKAELLPACESTTAIIYCPTASVLGIAARISVLLTNVTASLSEPTNDTLVVGRKLVPEITRIPLCPTIICPGEVPVTVIGWIAGSGVASCAATSVTRLNSVRIVINEMRLIRLLTGDLFRLLTFLLHIFSFLNNGLFDNTPAINYRRPDIARWAH